MGITVVAGWGIEWEVAKGNFMGRMKIFYIFIWMMVTWIYMETYIWNGSYGINIRSVHLTVYKPYLFKIFKLTCK